MKLEILAECITRLSKCDIDNPLDQKTISVCESYILESYNDYLYNCNINYLEPLSETEYMQELMLNEGFFKKLLKGTAIVGGTVAVAGGGAVKARNAVNAYGQANGQATGGAKNFGNNFKSMYKQSGGIIGTTKNIAKTSINKNVANQQFKGANSDQQVENGKVEKRSLTLASGKDARNAVKNNINLQGTNTFSFYRQKQGEEKPTKVEVDANSEQGQRIQNGINKNSDNNNPPQNNNNNNNNNNPPQNNNNNNNNNNNPPQNNNNNNNNPPQNNNNPPPTKAKNQNNTKTPVDNSNSNPVNETLKTIVNKIFNNSNILNENNSIELMNLSFNEIMNLAIDCPYVSLEELEYISTKKVPEYMIKNVLRESLNYSYNAKTLNKPLTPSIKMPAKIY